MMKFWERIKEQGVQIVQEAKEEMNISKVVHINTDAFESENEELTLEEVQVESVKQKKRKNIEIIGVKGSVALPCSRCEINDLCKKAYSVNIPKYDADIFDLEVSCSRIIESLDIKEDAQGIYLEEVTSKSQLPCHNCAIGDICSKANSLKLPAHDKEMFTIGVSCKRFINK